MPKHSPRMRIINLFFDFRPISHLHSFQWLSAPYPSLLARHTRLFCIRIAFFLDNIQWTQIRNWAKLSLLDGNIYNRRSPQFWGVSHVQFATHFVVIWLPPHPFDSLMFSLTSSFSHNSTATLPSTSPPMYVPLLIYAPSIFSSFCILCFTHYNSPSLAKGRSKLTKVRVVFCLLRFFLLAKQSSLLWQPPFQLWYVMFPDLSKNQNFSASAYSRCVNHLNFFAKILISF